VLRSLLKNKFDQGKRVRLNPPVHAVLQDFRWLAGDLTRRPNHIAELVPRAKPDTFGAQDAAAVGMGGVHFVPHQDGSILPLMWRSPFPHTLQTRLVTFEHPGGDINNS
jgi:hypothetical protein